MNINLTQMSNIRFFFVGALILHLLSFFFDSDIGINICAEPISLGATALAGGFSLGNTLLGNVLGRSNADKSVAMQKDLMKYQFDNFTSPKALVSNLASAGINPSVAFSNGFNQAVPSASAPQVSPLDIGLSGSDIAETLLTLAEAKKAGADKDLVEKQANKTVIESEALNFELSLNKEFGKQKWIVDLKQAYQNLKLANQSEDLNEQQKAINEWKKVSEKALSEANEHQRDILKKRLANTDKELELSNKLASEKINTEKSSQTANYAAANASNSVAAVNREQRRLTAALADIEEDGKPDKLESLIAEYKKNKSISDSDAKEAEIRLSRLLSVEDKRSSYFFNEVDNYLEWLKDKVSIFKTK